VSLKKKKSKKKFIWLKAYILYKTSKNKKKKMICSKSHMLARNCWVTSIILATWVTEIRRIKVQGQPGQEKFMRLLSQQEKAGHDGVYLLFQPGRKPKREGYWSRLAWAKRKTLSPK
jgi:hypothetical protein